MPEYYSVVWMDHILFVHWSTDGQFRLSSFSDCEQSCSPSDFEFIDLRVVIWELHLRKPKFSDSVCLRSESPTVLPENTHASTLLPDTLTQQIWVGLETFIFNEVPPFTLPALVQMTKLLFCKKLKRRKASVFELWVHFFSFF